MRILFYVMIAAGIITVPLAVYAAEPELIEFSDIGRYILFENNMKLTLDMPITAVNYKTGQPEPDKQITTDYSRPIFHENKSDGRIVAFIDQHADKRGQTVIDPASAIVKGWNLDKGGLP